MLLRGKIMNKPKIYLDTSVISHLKHDDVPDKMHDTLRLWKLIKDGIYKVFISDMVLREIANCPDPKRSILLTYLSEIEYTQLIQDIESETLANEIIKQGILKQKNFDDCLHIAMAVVNNCDIIVSWNFAHMVNINTINGVRAINLLNGYRTIDIYSPSVLI